MKYAIEIIEQRGIAIEARQKLRVHGKKLKMLNSSLLEGSPTEHGTRESEQKNIEHLDKAVARAKQIGCRSTLASDSCCL